MTRNLPVERVIWILRGRWDQNDLFRSEIPGSDSA